MVKSATESPCFVLSFRLQTSAQSKQPEPVFGDPCQIPQKNFTQINSIITKRCLSSMQNMALSLGLTLMYKNREGHVVWNNNAYDFLSNTPYPEIANPKL
jgi:alkyl sulfatase BDS1-like metallo-beta-lactamase superfamily hydrolase